MKKILLLIAVGCLMASLIPALAQNKDKRQFAVYGVAFYNLENLFDTINNNGKYDLEFSPQGKRQWDSKKYWSKINNLANVLANMTSQTTPAGPAIIGVAEIENRSVLEDLVNAEPIKERNLQIVHHDSPDRRGVDVSLLYNPDMFTLLNVTNHTLVIDGKDDFLTRDQMCVTGILGIDTVSVIVNHWPSRLGGRDESSYLREAAALLSKHIADSIWALRPDEGIMIMGDLNDDPHDRSCAVALGAVRNSRDATLHGFYNPWWTVLDNGVGTLAYKGAWNLFDQIIVSGTLLRNLHPDGLEYWKCQVDNFDFMRDNSGEPQGYPLRTYSRGMWINGYSDHFPTEIFLIRKR